MSDCRFGVSPVNYPDPDVRNLNLFKDLGMKLTKIHRVLQFNESPWLAKYIDFNTNKRSNAKMLSKKIFLN